jgi:hypothetical protein
MKWSKFSVLALAVSLAASVWLVGCGGGAAVNVITVSVSPPSQLALAGQTYNFTATVSGSTTLTVSTWTCSYSYTPLPTQSTPNPKAVTGTCTSGGTISGVTGKIGTWTISTANNSNVLTYIAPALADFPSPAPTLTFTAESDANKKKTGTATVALDSGIRVSVQPASAIVPVGLTPAQTAVFYPAFLNANASGQQFKLVQPNTASTTTADQQATPQTPDTCDPTCGTIDNATGTYTAPATLPTDTKPAGSKSTSATTVYVVTWNSADPNHYALAQITLVAASTNAVDFTGIYPPTIAAGGLLQDVFLSAKNLLNTTIINFVPPTAQSNLTANSGTPLDLTTQIFTIPISKEYCTPTTGTTTPVVTCDASIMTRVRLNAAQLTSAEPDPSQPAWILIPDLPGTATVTGNCQQLTPQGAVPTAIACPLHIINASPTLVAAAPNSFSQNTQNSGTIQVAVDGGYFGATSNLVNVTFNGQVVYKPNQTGTASQTGARQLIFSQDNAQLPPPGLYEISLESSASTGTPPPFLTATTNTAIQPDFATAPVPVSVPLNVTPATGPNLAPSYIALESVKGYAVIVEQASNTLQLVDLTGPAPVQVGSPFPLAVANTPTATASAPTGFAIDDQLSVNGGDLGILVSSGDSKLYLYSVNPKSSPSFSFITSIPVDLQTLLSEPGITGLPIPFAFGVDPTTHLGVVAYTGTNIGTNIAFVVDVDPNLNGNDTPPAGLSCFLGGKPPCVIAPVSVITGPTPQVVMQPQVPLAYVTPGGGNGVTSVVNLLQQAASVKILPASSASQTASGAFRTAGITTIKTVTPHGINAGLGGTVIISGVTTSTANSNFNGTFLVRVIDPYTFNYAQTGMPDDTETNTSSNEGTVQYGMPYFSFSTSNNVQGAAINPITRTFAYADFFSTTAQIGFISTLDQTFNSLLLSAGSCNGCIPNPSGGPEVNFRSVAWDPFTNVLLAYNPGLNVGLNFPENAISLINPPSPAPGGGSTQPYRIIAAIPTGQVGTGSYTPSGATSPVTVYGPMTYDPKSKFALVANAGSNTLTYMSLDPTNSFQNVHIQSLLLQDTVPAYGVPVAQPLLGSLAPATTCSLADPARPCMPQAVRLGQDAYLRVLGQGFSSGGGSPVARLDGRTAIIPPGQTTPIPIVTTFISDSEVDVTVPAAVLYAPHVYALDVQSSAGGATSNAIDLYAVGILDMTPTCAPTSSIPQGPEGVAIDESRRVALVTNYACNSVSFINLDQTGLFYPGSPYGAVLSTIGVGKNPIGVGVIPRLGYAVVANSGESPTGTASIINISNPLSPSIVQWSTTSGSTTTTTNAGNVGISPVGVTIDQDRALAFIANNGSNTISAIDLTVLLPGAVTTKSPEVTTIGLSGPPTAIAVDPNRAIAVVTNLQNSGTTGVTGGLDVINLSTDPPAKSSTNSINSLTANPTGIVYDPGDPNQTPAKVGLFYATSTQQNAVYSFNPDTGSTQLIRVGINPYSVGFNYQTGTLMTINSTSNSSSIIDVQNFKTRETLGISSLSQFAVGVDNLTNTGVIADQNNNRVVFLALPK